MIVWEQKSNFFSKIKTGEAYYGKKVYEYSAVSGSNSGRGNLTAYVGKGSGNVLLYNFTFLGLMLIIYAVGLLQVYIGWITCQEH